MFYGDETERQSFDSVKLSLRHTAAGAGLGTFGLHNLVIHPKMGSRVIFSAVLTDLELEPDATIPETLCTECGIYTAECPGHALDEDAKRTSSSVWLSLSHMA